MESPDRRRPGHSSSPSCSSVPGGTVHALAETPTAVWVATDEGFFWFDEFRWQRALPDAGTPLPIVRSWIAPDLRGGVLAVRDGQLYRGDESGLTPVPGVVTFARRAVPLDSSAVLVLGTPVEGGPADLFVIRNGIVAATSTPGDVPGGFEGPEQLWRTDAGRVWLNSSQGLSYWDGDGWVVAHPALAPGQSLLALWENEDGQGFAAFRHPSSMRGLWQWRGSGPLTRVRSEGEEHLGNLLGTGPDGAVIAFHETGHVRAFVDDVWTSVDPLPRELRGATFLTSRPNGDSWLGTPEGLSLYVRSFNRWSLRQYPFNDVRNWTNELLPASDGSLWIGTRGGVVHQREGQDDVWYREAAGRPVGAVTGLAEDALGRIWASGGGQIDGALRWDGTDWSHLTKDRLAGATRIHRLDSDDEGRIWMMALGDSAGGAGLYVYEDGEVSIWEREGFPTGRRVYSSARASDGTVWVGTQDRLSRWRGDSWTHWTRDDGWDGGSIFTLALDDDGRVWFSTRRGGEGYVDGDDRIRGVSPRDGLDRVSVWELVVDDSGRLWASTVRGLSTYEDGVWSSFDPPSGLTHARLWPIVPLDDRVLVGTLGSGVAILSRAEEADEAPRVVITPPTDRSRSGSLRWSANARWGSLAAAAVATRYRLDGADWTAWSLDRDLSFRGLSPGEHTITVQAKGPFGQFDASARPRDFGSCRRSPRGPGS